MMVWNISPHTTDMMNVIANQCLNFFDMVLVKKSAAMTIILEKKSWQWFMIVQVQDDI